MAISFFKKIFSKEKEEISDREKFEGAMCFARQVASQNKEDLYPIIRAFGKKIQYQRLADFIQIAGINGDYEEKIRLPDIDQQSLWIDTHDESFNRLYRDEFYSIIVKCEGRKSFKTSLIDDVVLPWPWRRVRLIQALKSIGDNREWGKWKYDQSNHDLCVWLPINIFFVHGGNHSLAAGILKNEGTLESRSCFDMAQAYQRIKTDGEYYYLLKDSEEVKLSKVRNLDFAIIYEIGRMLLWECTEFCV